MTKYFVNHLLADLMTIQSKTPSKGSSGGNLNAYTTAQENVACSIGPINSKDHTIYAQRRLEVTHSIWTNQSVSVNDGDRILLNGILYSVRGVRALTGRLPLTVIDVVRYMGGGQ